jgi:hypothetical protein
VGPHCGLAEDKPEIPNLLKELIETEQMKLVNNRSYSLGKMPDAHRYVDQGRKGGSAGITVGHAS